MGTKKKLLFVFNPFSGKAQIKNQLLDIVDVMVKADYEVTIYPTQAQGDAIHKIETEAGDYDLVVCSGGDGTLDEVVTGMMHREKKVPLGYIAAGSTNDFATSLGIPKNMVKALQDGCSRATSERLTGTSLYMWRRSDCLRKFPTRRARSGRMCSDTRLTS
jgi:diacylglycerol kinase family enzyme